MRDFQAFDQQQPALPENCSIRKTTQIRGTINKKREKEAFVGVYDERKSTKIGFPSRGKIKNRQKSAFPHGGKAKIGEKRLSQYWEE